MQLHVLPLSPAQLQEPIREFILACALATNEQQRSLTAREVQRHPLEQPKMRGIVGEGDVGNELWLRWYAQGQHRTPYAQGAGVLVNCNLDLPAGITLFRGGQLRRGFVCCSGDGS